MSTAEATRDAVRRQPFLLDALRAGVLNYAAAAAILNVDGDEDAVATALRRFGEELSAFETADRDARVTMQSGVGLHAAEEMVEDTEPLLMAGQSAVSSGGSLTAVLATGEVDPVALGAVCDRLAAEGIDAQAAAVAGDSLVVVVERRKGAKAVQAVESALAHVPA
jgi:hypothetical protein